MNCPSSPRKSREPGANESGFPGLGIPLLATRFYNVKGLSEIRWSSAILLLNAEASMSIEAGQPVGGVGTGKNVREHRGSFTGPEVPSLSPLMGDFVNEGGSHA